MFVETIKQLKISLIFLIIFTILTGLIYPIAVAVFAQCLCPWKANGSLLQNNGKVIGSLLIGQYFDSPLYFWGRPSATPHFPYNAAFSSGSNMGPSNPSFLATVKERIAKLQKPNEAHITLIPVDLVTASGSGLDPEISPLAAFYQISRIAKARQVSEKAIQTLIQNQINPRTFGILGEPRVNVLTLNLALDRGYNNGRATPKS